MITEDNIHKFWRAVSHACDTLPNNRDSVELFETKAMLAFTEILDFCENIPGDPVLKRETAFDLINYTTSNDGKVVFNIAASMPEDIYKHGTSLAQIASKQYTPT
jgi:hypothetical protein